MESVSHTAKEDVQTLKDRILCSIAANYLETTPPQSGDERNDFKNYLREMQLILKGFYQGSLVITVKCESLQILEELWKDYSSGHLGEVIQNCFVTEKILKELNLAELRLKTTMNMEEYNACKVYFEKVALRGASPIATLFTAAAAELEGRHKTMKLQENKTLTLKVPTMSRQLEKDSGERKLRVTLLSAEWKTSRNGDLTTINRELAIQMAKHSNVEVSVFLPQCSEEDKKIADKKYNVKLIEAVEIPGWEPVDWLASVPDTHAMDCVIGHGVALGRQIPLIKKNPNYSHCRWIQVIHSAPEEIGMFKNTPKGHQMQKTEVELGEMADQVVTIGSKLSKVYKCQLKKQDVFNLTPSIFTEFSDVQQASDERKTFCVLVIESGDSEDFDAKGYDIAAKAIANLQDKSYQLKFASKQRGKETEIAEKLVQCGIARSQLIVRSFDENRETLANLFCEVDIAILPSRSEGFGLSALEAISAGLPILVSENSGIAEALRGVPNGSQCIVVDSEHPANWASAIKDVRDKARNVRLAEAKDLCAKYLQVYSWEEPCGFLVEKMNELVFGGSGDTRNKKHEAPSSSNLYTVKKGKSQVSEQASDPVPDPGNITNKKRKAPHSSNLYPVEKGKSQVSEEASDPVPDAAALLQTCDSSLSTLERTNTQSIPLPATETSNNKGGVPIETKGWNSLHSAAESGNEGIIEILLSSGLDIDSRGNDGTTPLMVAAAAGKEETVNLLLCKGADPHLKNYIGRNLLHAAAEGGNTSIVERMLSYGIDIDSRDDECSATPLIIATMFNNVEVMKYLLQKGANLSVTTGSTKRNLLHIASEYGSVAAIEMLFSYGLSLDSRDGEGNMPLACAAACGQIKAVNCLLEHGADPLLKGKHGWNLLHFAAQSGNVTIIDTMLSKGLDIDSRGETLGLTPLLVSLKFGKLGAAKHLLGKGANEFTALAFAAASNSVAAIAMLLSHGLSIDSRDAEGDTPLFYAARCGSTEALNYLVEQGADPLLQNNSEFGLLHLAALSNNVATIEAVLSKNFDINIRTSSLGITPLFVSLFKGNLEAANYLLERGADEHLKSEEGWTVLSAAASGGNVAVIEMLRNRGHNPNSRDGCDRTPLMYAAEKGNKAAVEYLLPLTH